MRITTNTLMRNAQLNLQGSMTSLAKTQSQASTLQKITKPSDDPTGTANSMLVRGEQRANAQYERNIGDGVGWLATIDSTLTNVADLLGRVRVLTVQGANDGSMSPTAKEAIAVELESLREELLTQANTKYLGRTVFAGNSDAGVAFASDDPLNLYSYNGAATSTVERRIDATTTVRVDADGAMIFGEGATSAFALVDRIVANLRNGTNIGFQLNEIDDRLQSLNAQRATVGTHHAQVLRAEETNLQQMVALETQRSGIEDLDLAKAILDLQLQEMQYQSSLSVTARVLQPTLMDFLR